MADYPTSLLAILGDQIELLLSLNDILRRESDALENYDFESLRGAVSLKREVSEKIIFTEKQLKFLLTQHNCACISDLISSDSGTMTQEILSRKDHVAELYAINAELNKKNGDIVQRSLKRTKGTVAFLKRAISGGTTYTEKGDMSPGRRGARFQKEF